MKIYCTCCKKDVDAVLTNGKEIYPHRPDLHNLPFWKCPGCNYYVGCHHKTKNRTKPLGCIPTQEIKNARKCIHQILDPLWKNGKYKRKDLYKKISDKFGWRFHTANIKSIDEARSIYKYIRTL